MEKIFIPQEDVNSEGATIIELRKNNYDTVLKDEVIGSVETTKAIFDLISPFDGTIFFLINEKSFVPYHKIVAVIGKDKNEIDDYNKKLKYSKNENDDSNTSFTKKAIQLAQQKNFDISSIVSDKIITEKDIILMTKDSKSIESDIPSHTESQDQLSIGSSPIGLNRILILGGGLGAMQVIDILLHKPENQIVGILDDNQDLKNTNIFGISVLGEFGKLKDLWDKEFFNQAIVSISTDISVRKKLYDTCKSYGIEMVNAICPSARINRHSVMGEGNVICSLVHIGTCSVIGNNNFISAHTNIEHHNVWESNITTGPNCITSSRVTIKCDVKLGTGIFIQPGISIGKNCLIASGSIITKTIPDNHAIKTKLSYEMKPID